MTQTERRIYLIRELLKEQPQYAELEILRGEQEQRRLLRSLFNVRPPRPATPEFLEIQDEYLREVTRQKGVTDLKDLEPVRDGIYLWRGDITTFSERSCRADCRGYGSCNIV